MTHTKEDVVKLAAEFDKRFTSMNGVDVPERVSVPRDEWRALHTAIKQALASPAQSEPVAHRQGFWCADLTCKKCYSAEFRFKHTTLAAPVREPVEQALDKMAENARELGLDYEPVQALAAPVQKPVACVQDLDEVKRKHLVYEKGMDWKDPLYTTPPAAQPVPVSGYIKKIEDLIQERDDARKSRDFYKRRADALQEWQSKMRDPERTIVCDILANGHTLEPAGDRYTPPAAEQPAEPQGWKLVPVEPTEIMQDAGVVVMPTVDCHPYDAGMVYKAMLTAAPEKDQS